MKDNTIRVEISYKTISFSVLFILALLGLWELRQIVSLFFVCLILMEAINPVVNKLEQKGLSRSVAIIFIYIFILVFLSTAVASITPPLISQINGLINFLPKAVGRLNLMGISANDISSQMGLLQNLPSQIAKTTISIFSNIFGGVVVMMITFYMLLERKHMTRRTERLLGKKNGGLVMETINQIEARLTGWSKAELLLMLVVGLLSYTGYAILGVDFALALAIIAGILEIIPNIGPTLSTILAGVVALNQSMITVGLVIIWGILVQQLENNFIVPKIMKKQVGLSPVVTIFALAIGAKLGGVVGTLLAIPSFLAIETALRVFLNRDK